MPTAFGSAMLEALAGHAQTFGLSFNGDPPIALPCEEFLRLRQDEVDLLGQITLPVAARVLDYGSGAGRHLKHLRAARADIHCIGVEACDGLRAHCAAAVAQPATFVAEWQRARDEGPFDLILLIGNGLGVLGDEMAARAGLRELVESMAPGARLVIETGLWCGQGYRTDTLEIHYNGRRDGPFPWGGADRVWLVETLEALGCEITVSDSHAPDDFFFFAVVTKRRRPMVP